MQDFYSVPFALIEENGTTMVETREALAMRTRIYIDLMERTNVTGITAKMVSQMAVGACLTIVRYETVVHFANRTSELPSYGTIVLRQTDGEYAITATISPIIKLANYYPG